MLGGANLTVGGATEQFLWRYVIGAAVGAACFSALGALGSNAAAQGVIFFLFVFVLTLVRVKIRKADIGLTFATLACVYAVDNSWQDGNSGQVDTLALRDLLRAWTFGAAISLVRDTVCFACGLNEQVVNFAVLPVKASGLAKNRTAKALTQIRNITAWLFAASSTGTTYTPAEVRRTLYADHDTLVALQSELAWEFGWSASTLDQRQELLDAVLAVQKSLVIGTRNGAFVSDLPVDLAEMVRPAVATMAHRAFDEMSTLADSRRSHHFRLCCCGSTSRGESTGRRGKCRSRGARRHRRAVCI